MVSIYLTVIVIHIKAGILNPSNKTDKVREDHCQKLSKRDEYYCNTNGKSI